MVRLRQAVGDALKPLHVSLELGGTACGGFKLATQCLLLVLPRRLDYGLECGHKIYLSQNRISRKLAFISEFGIQKFMCVL
jgi:hypothetical protein